MMVNRSPLKRQRAGLSAATGKHGNYILNNQTTIRIRHVLSQLQLAITGKQRVTALQQLLNFIGYDPSTRTCRSHNVILTRLLEGKCIHFLCLQLGYTLNKKSFCRENHLHTIYPSEEILLILIAFEVFYRHCPELITEDSIRDEGTEVLRHLQDILSHHLGELVGVSTVRSGFNAFSYILSIIAIWHYLSSCNSGTMLLLQNPKALRGINIILSAERIQSHQRDIKGIEIIMECLGLLKNLSYYGEDYRHLLVDQSDLITTLTSLTDVPNDKARERLSAVFRNLALSPDTRTRLTRRADVLTAILRMISFGLSKRISSNIENDTYSNSFKSKKNVIRNILSTISSLAIDTSTTHLIVFHGDGVLIEQLKQFVVSNADCVAQKRAIRALGLLARDPSSTPIMVLQNNQLLEILLDRSVNDMNDSVRSEATEAFAKIAQLIQAPMAQHNYILDALTRMLLTAETKPQTVTTNVETVVRTIREQASHHVNHKAMTQHSELLRALANVIRSEYSTLSAKDSACATLVDLSADEHNQLAIVRPIILGTLVETLEWQPRARTNNDAIAIAITNIDTIVTNRIRESSVQTILNLSKKPCNRVKLAQQAKLIQSLVGFAAASTTSDDIKKQVKVAILQLATEL